MRGSETYGILLGSGHLLDSKGIVEEGVTREVFLDILLDELNTKIRVVHTLDLVSNSADWKGIQNYLPNRKRCNVLSLLAFLDSSTNSRGVRPLSRAPENMEAASSRAPPNRLPMVRRPEARDEIKSLPAREATIVFMALCHHHQHTIHLLTN
jgi:hypothetical protein